jgi:hypothetical protein
VVVVGGQIDGRSKVVAVNGAVVVVVRTVDGAAVLTEVERPDDRHAPAPSTEATSSATSATKRVRGEKDTMLLECGRIGATHALQYRYQRCDVMTK